MRDNDTPTANPMIVLREEFDESAILFDPDSGDSFAVNPTGVFIWKHLDGLNTIENILKELRDICKDIPEEAKDHLHDFIQDLVKQGFVTFKKQDV